ncbi:MAG: hypothetical protein WBA77_12685 [Microcoleaceae cyanobacterium]
MNLSKIINLAHQVVNGNEEVEVITQPPSAETLEVIEMLRSIAGMMVADKRDFKSATPYFRLKDGTIVKLYENQLNVLHIFLADKTGEKFIYGGYTLLSKAKLESVIREIQQQYGEDQKNKGWKWR